MARDRGESKLAARQFAHLRGAARGRNVLWIILESTGASYLGSYGAEPDPTPKLSALAEHAVIFESCLLRVPREHQGIVLDVVRGTSGAVLARLRIRFW